MAALGAVLRLLNLFAYELTGLKRWTEVCEASAIRHHRRRHRPGPGGLSLRQLVRSVATALSDEDQLVDVMPHQPARRRAMGPVVVAIGGGTGLSQLLSRLSSGAPPTSPSPPSPMTAEAQDGSLATCRLAPACARTSATTWWRAADERTADNTPAAIPVQRRRCTNSGHSLGSLLIAALTIHRRFLTWPWGDQRVWPYAARAATHRPARRSLRPHHQAVPNCAAETTHPHHRNR